MLDKQEQISFQQIQKLEFGILKFLKKICEEHNINYYLAYGTLIGAVRHGGFIPWDDDIDIMMPREDYQKLLQVLKKQPHPYYKLISVDTDDEFQVPLPKVIDSRTILVQDYDMIEPVPLGVYVDIFLIDGAGNDYNEAISHYDQSFELYRYWKKSRLKLFPTKMSKVRGLLRWLKNIPYIIKGSRYYMDQLTEHNKKCSFYNSDYVATFETGTSEATKCIWERNFFSSGTSLKFNGELFQVPKEYDKILRSEYGNYMKIPPITDQISHHSYELMWNKDTLEEAELGKRV